MVNTPIPHSLKSEAKKAAKILQDFSMPSTKVGPDALIPAGIIVRAAGLAILSVVKVGFLVTARGGSGIVIAKLNDGSWSAPSAIGIAGLGGGFEIGAEVTDFVIILNSKAAVDAFSMGGNLTLGGNFTIAAGPIGRNIEGDVSLRSTAAIYTYSRTKGLFAGISIEGSCLIERKDANKKFYCENLRAHQILSGEIAPPDNCQELYEMLRHHEEMLFKVMKSQAKAYASKKVHEELGWEAETVPTGEQTSPSSAPKSAGKSKTSRTPSRNYDIDDDEEHRELGTSVFYDAPRTSKSSGSSKQDRSPCDGLPDYTTATSSKDRPPDYSSVASTSYDRVPGVDVKSQCFESSPEPKKKTPTFRVQVLFPYSAEKSCDLSFDEGDLIEVLTRTQSQDDWWEGRMITSAGEVYGKTGIFPATYVQLD